MFRKICFTILFSKDFNAFSYTTTNVESKISSISGIKLVLVASKNKNILTRNHWN